MADPQLCQPHGRGADDPGGGSGFSPAGDHHHRLLIEEETDGGSANIASVIYNRLEGSGNKQGTYGLHRSTPLLYALPDHRPHHQRGHADRLPYNLCQNAGLPHAHLNPGLASIDAALNPNTDYYYHALGTDGKHHFSTTLAEHSAFVNSGSYGG
ncbi:MAG: endolytic transglycosylase MltG [Dysosmobacter welbionis]